MLTESNIKKGFQLGHAVAVGSSISFPIYFSNYHVLQGETLSAQPVITGELYKKEEESNALPLLEQLMNEVFSRRAEQNAAIP